MMRQHWITWAQSLILHIQQKAFLDLILNHTNYESFMTAIFFRTNLKWLCYYLHFYTIELNP